MGDSRITIDFVQNLLKNEYPSLKITSLSEAPGSKRGDNYTAMLYRVFIEGTVENIEKNEEIFKSSLIYKCLPENLTRREAFKSDALFCNEVAFYTKILPRFVRFRHERLKQSENTLKAIPKCYFAQNDLVILEDLQLRDFKMTDRKRGLSETQCFAVLKELACLHSTSLAMKCHSSDEFHELISLQDGISEGLFDRANEEWYREYYRTAARNAIIMLKEALSVGDNNEEYLEKFINFVGDGTFFMKMVDLVAPREPLAVICHGDCWTNNILFHYDIEEELKEVCFVDFQLARYGSPALDLANLLYCCTTREQRMQHLDTFLEFYCDALREGFMELIDADNYCGPLSDKRQLLDMVREEFHRCGKFGLGLALDMFPIMTCDSDQAPDLYQLEDENDETEPHIPVWTSNEACRQKLYELVLELVDKGQL